MSSSLLLGTASHHLGQDGQYVGLAQSGRQVAARHLGQAAAQEPVGRGQGGQGGPGAGEGEARLGEIPAGQRGVRLMVVADNEAEGDEQLEITPPRDKILPETP